MTLAMMKLTAVLATYVVIVTATPVPSANLEHYDDLPGIPSEYKSSFFGWICGRYPQDILCPKELPVADGALKLQLIQWLCNRYPADPLCSVLTLRGQSTTFELPKEAKEVYDQVKLCYTTPDDPSCNPLYEYFQRFYENFCSQFLTGSSGTVSCDFSQSDLSTFAKGIYDKAVECAASPDEPSCVKYVEFIQQAYQSLQMLRQAIEQIKLCTANPADPSCQTIVNQVLLCATKPDDPTCAQYIRYLNQYLPAEKVMNQQQSIDYSQVIDQIILCTTTPDDPSCPEVQLPSQVKAILNQIVQCVQNPDDPVCVQRKEYLQQAYQRFCQMLPNAPVCGDVSLNNLAKFAKGLYDMAVGCAADPMHSSCSQYIEYAVQELQQQVIQQIILCIKTPEDPSCPQVPEQAKAVLDMIVLCAANPDDPQCSVSQYLQEAYNMFCQMFPQAPVCVGSLSDLKDFASEIVKQVLSCATQQANQPVCSQLTDYFQQAYGMLCQYIPSAPTCDKEQVDQVVYCITNPNHSSCSQYLQYYQQAKQLLCQYYQSAPICTA